jgi:uncharacterized protein (TIGR02284 family)
METSQKIIRVLNELLEKNLDAIQGYAEVADQEISAGLRAYFRRGMSMREQFAEELESEIVDFGGEPVTETSLASKLHRAWINLKAAWSDREELAVIAECIRGEKASLRDYSKALETFDLPVATEILLLEHQGNIRQMVEELEDMESASEDYLLYD